MYNVFIILFFSSPLLFLATYLMTAKRKSFWKIFTVHTLVFISYMIFTINYTKLLFPGHDEYGLGPIILGTIFIIGHVIIGFVHGLYITLKRRKENNGKKHWL